MSKEIIEGCRAVICKGAYKGLHVVVGKYLGTIPFHRPHKQWEIDKPVEISDDTVVYHKAEEYLQRIDDQDATTWDEVQKTCHWSPEVKA